MYVQESRQGACDHGLGVCICSAHDHGHGRGCVGVVFQASHCYHGFSDLTVGMFEPLQDTFINATRVYDKTLA